MEPTKTSWDNVADWYDDMLEQNPDSFQKNVLMPNLIRIVEPKKGMTILDLACGQGYFARAFFQNGAKVIGYDISKELITLALEQEKKRKLEEDKIQFHVSPADSLPFIKDGTIDVVTIVLALQNIENIQGVFTECSRVLKIGGRLVIVINHPAFRIPQRSGWGWDEKTGKQYRQLDAYMSDDQIKIDMTPGEKLPQKKKSTISFHRPLQSYFKAISKAGFSVTRLEEWISHKKSQDGPRATEEDRMRKEIPMFLCLEAKKG
ncbi:MAG: class I SAM-dependent methyltransferase [Patescibacteria group bacterium]